MLYNLNVNKFKDLNSSIDIFFLLVIIFNDFLCILLYLFCILLYLFIYFVFYCIVMMNACFVWCIRPTGRLSTQMRCTCVSSYKCMCLMYISVRYEWCFKLVAENDTDYFCWFIKIWFIYCNFFYVIFSFFLLRSQSCA